MNYDHSEVEPRWQKFWEENKTFQASTGSSKQKFYVLDMFPYPSGTGLHVGHPKGYLASDVVARYKVMCGYQVLHPMGWDAFGLPAERQAIKEGLHPADITERNVATFRRQLKRLGFAYDWDREISTASPGFYKWTQWVFLRMLEHNLAYEDEALVYWCPALGTVVSHEEIENGTFKDTGDPVEPRFLRQWFLRITSYADRLLKDLDALDWPEEVKKAQRNWIGRSDGAMVRFNVIGDSRQIEVFSTRPDTLFGACFLVLAPEHQLSRELARLGAVNGLADYIDRTLRKKPKERDAQSGPPTGVFAGLHVLSPVDGRELPVWIADYVKLDYGTGAVFGCPAHDERDHAFANQFNLPIIEVVRGGNVVESAYSGDGEHVNSGFLNTLGTKEAIQKIIPWLEETGNGKAHIAYKLRDWLFSRQRYWGEPIPVVHCDSCGIISVPEGELPVHLPHVDHYAPEGNPESVLSRFGEWVQTRCPKCARPARRETNTMPQWAGSSWYFLRYIDPKNDASLCDPSLQHRWMPVDLYVGGMEHAVRHLIYARFWHKVLFDLGVATTPEPFPRLFNQGLVLAPSYRDLQGKYHHEEEVERRNESHFLKGTDQRIQVQLEKMSKSKLNTVSLDSMADTFGADVLRLFEVSMAPPENDCVWRTEHIIGSQRLLDRLWRFFFPSTVQQSEDDALQVSPEELDRLMHTTIRNVTKKIESMRLNTIFADISQLVKTARATPEHPADLKMVLIKLVAPIVPHFAEEVWDELGNTGSIFEADWPMCDPLKAASMEVTVAVQINGRTRGHVVVEVDTEEEQIVRAVKQSVQLGKFLEDKEIVRTHFKVNKIVNIMVR